MTQYLGWRYLMLPMNCILYSEQVSDGTDKNPQLQYNKQQDLCQQLSTMDGLLTRKRTESLTESSYPLTLTYHLGIFTCKW